MNVNKSLALVRELWKAFILIVVFSPKHICEETLNINDVDGFRFRESCAPQLKSGFHQIKIIFVIGD